MSGVSLQGLLARLKLGPRHRLPVVLQTEAAECGLACLAMIAGYHGSHVDLAVLRRRHPASLKGMTLASLIEIATRLDLASRPVRLEMQDLKHLRVPSILHWNFDHFVVLARVRRGAVDIHDPAHGRRCVPLPQVARQFTGVALELWPKASFRPRQERITVRLRDLLGRTAGLKRSLLRILALAAALELFALSSPLYLQWIVDHVLVSGDRELLLTLAIGFALLVVLEQAIAMLRSWAVIHLATLLNVQWQANALAHLLRLPLPYFEKRHLGDIVSRFRSIEVIQRTLSSSSAEALVDGAVGMAIALVLLRYHTTLGVLCLGATALYGMGRALTYRPMRRATEEQIVHLAKQESHFIETVRGVRAVKLFAREESRRTAWLGLLVEQVNAGIAVQRLQVLLRLGNGLLLGGTQVVVTALAAHEVLDGRFSAGMLVAFAAYQRQFLARIAALLDKSVELRMLRLHADRLADVLLEPTEDQSSGDRLLAGEHEPVAASIELRALSFRYGEHEPYVLESIDCRIAAGEAVAVIGPSGSGKSTLVHLLLGILQPTAGEVLIGGVPITRMPTATLRRTVASVTQNDTLFAGTIADNISFFDDRSNQDRIEHCARLAAIHDDIAALPMAYNTHVGYLGGALSGGQQQRILLARALYAAPRILVLDEATSHLDLQRERQVAAALRRLAITRIIVAHRPETAATADRVLTLAAGRIVRDERRRAINGTAPGLMPRPTSLNHQDGAAR